MVSNRSPLKPHLRPQTHHHEPQTYVTIVPLPDQEIQVADTIKAHCEEFRRLWCHSCKEFLVNVDQEDYEKGVDVEPFTGQAECDCYGVLSSNIQNTSISFPNLKSTCLILANSLLLGSEFFPRFDQLYIDNRVLINFHLQHISVPCPSGTRVHYKIENINGSNSHLKISSCSATMLWASSVACCDFLINLAQDPTTTNKPLVYIKQD
ncbi:hypothetical protein PSTT_06201 [Puccinia striiformis]|uniref:Uncharacterized protein n=1 Tax=Puccinia striiformis TaxID=27350 RepID=A0A2S4VLC4_9BASI|nr:hypothetical protein PSTT_06201 [Puccinia striiformis]